MTDPSIEFQTAIRSALINDPAISTLVPADQVRAGSTRPDKLPCIILATPQTIHKGRSGKNAFLAETTITLHVWAIDDGADMCQRIGHAVSMCLYDPPINASNDVNDYERPSFTYMRDPDPALAQTHGVATVTGVVRWQP